MQRARRMEQKEERREAILAAAARVVAAQGPEALTLAQVAAEAGLAKGTLFLYFGTREELLLELLERRLDAFFTDVGTRLGGAAGAGRGARSIAGLLVEAVRRHESMLPLLGVLHAVLERNLTFERACSFKAFLATALATNGERLECALPGLRAGDGARAFLRLHALVIGLSQMAFPGALIERVLQREGFEALRIDFGRELSATLGALLEGMVQASPAPRTNSRRTR